MYACYIDESGHCGKKYDANQPVEVLVGIVTDYSKLFKTQREMRELFTELLKKDVKVKELKAKDAYNGEGAWKNIERKERLKIFETFIKWLIERKCKFIVCPIDSKKFFDLKDQQNQLARKFSSPYECGAINILLAIERHHKSKDKNKGRTFVVFDEQRDHDGHLKELLLSNLEYTDCYTGYEFSKKKKTNPPRLDQIVDIPYFSPSHASIIIQAADWVAYIVNKYLKLEVYGMPEVFEGERQEIRKLYTLIGEGIFKETAINPPAKNGELCKIYEEIRPEKWTPKKWTIQVDVEISN